MLTSTWQRCIASALIGLALFACSDDPMVVVEVPTEVTFRFCNSPEPGIPLWVGAQSANGPWSRVTAGAEHTYTFPIMVRGAIAFVYMSENAYVIQTIHGTASELTKMGTDWADLCRNAFGNREMTGTITGLPAGASAEVILGPSVAAFTSATTFRLEDVPDRPLDLVAIRHFPTPGRMIIRRGIEPSAGSAILPLDFGVEAFGLGTGSVTFAGLENPLGYGASFTTARGTAVYFGDQPLSGAPVSYRRVPVGQQSPRDLHLIGGQDLSPSGRRYVQAGFTDASPSPLTFGPHLSQPMVTTIATAPYARFRADLPSQPAYGHVAYFRLLQTATTGSTVLRAIRVSVSADYLGGRPSTWRMEVPDLAAVNGFDPTWGPLPDARSEWSVFGSSGWIFFNPEDGEVRVTAQYDGVGIGGAGGAVVGARPLAAPGAETLTRPRFSLRQRQ